MTADSRSNEHFILPSQLCVGLHVHLDGSWVDHPFTFSSFKIKSLDQVATLQSLGLTRVRYTPAKSDAAPLDAPPGPPPEPLASASSEDPAHQAKRERIERVVAQRKKVSACEREFISTTRTIKAINQNLFSQPAMVRQQAEELVQGVASSMLLDGDLAIQLMADKVGGEEVYLHSLNVMLLSMMLAREMKAPAAGIRLLGLGALFHDIGEVEIPDKVRRKLDPLNKAEQALMQQHCAYGVEIGRKLGLPPEAMSVLAQHHERIDGSGYPKALTGDQITLFARIVGIVDAYDELCNPVNPARALTPHEALGTMYAQQRARFDATAMAVFVRSLGVYPPGTIVVLSNGVLGMVVSVNSSRPLKPTVLIHDPSVPKEEAIVVDLEQEPEVTITKTLRPAQLDQAVFDYLSPRKRMAYYFDNESGKLGS